MFTFLAFIGNTILDWLLGDLRERKDPEAEEIKQDDALAEFVEKQKDLDYRLRNDPELAERIRLQLNARK